MTQSGCSMSWQEAMADITEYIEIFYNRQRLQARLGYLSPIAYAQQCYAGLLADDVLATTGLWYLWLYGSL
jgi:hypothetical protein